MNELISIVIPIYKVEKYLKRCIDSVINQTYSNLQIILVDDGSPDGCGAICDEYARLDNRVEVIHQKNGGLSYSRNAGIDISKGDYISFIDSDDWVHSEYIEKLYNILIKTNSDISVCSFISTFNENIYGSISKAEILEYTNIAAVEQIILKFDVRMVTTWGKLYKKSLFSNIKFPIGRIHEDEFTTYKVMFITKKVVLTSEQLYFYFQREDSIIGIGFNIKARLDVIAAYIERAEFFKELGLEELSSSTYKSLFFIFFVVNRQIDKFDTVISKKEYILNFKNLKKYLRKSNQKFRFRVFYELYYISPRTIDLLYRICVKFIEKE